MQNHSSKTNRWLTIFFAILLSIQIGYLLVGFASNVVFYQRVTTMKVETVFYQGKVSVSNEIIADMANDRGLSLEHYAIYRILANSLAGLLPFFLAIFIVIRAGNQWFAWYTAFILVYLGETAFAEQTLVSQLIFVEVFGANVIFWSLVLPYFFLFPNGNPVPRRAAWVVGAIVVYHFFIQVGTVAAYVLPELDAHYNFPSWGDSQYIWPVLVNFLIILACQVYRYRQVSNPIERKQMAWFLYGFGLMVALIPVTVYSGATGRTNDLNIFLWLSFSFSLAIAITRYRLWDIDVIIRKTLVYGILSATLALLYFGLVTLMQSLSASAFGRQSSVVIVLTTLAIAALFNPLRRRIQDFIDRRFYRKKYDAEKALAQFAEAARNETDIQCLNEALVDVVQDTMQPETVTLWLKSHKRAS